MRWSRKTPAVVNVADHCGERWQNLAGDRQPGRQSDHHHRTADGGQYHRFRDERRGSHQRAAFHHQWLPDELRVEKGFSPDTLKLLEAKGQKVALKEAMGSTQSIMVGPDGMLYGASDPRSPDDLTAGY